MLKFRIAEHFCPPVFPPVSTPRLQETSRHHVRPSSLWHQSGHHDLVRHGGGQDQYRFNMDDLALCVLRSEINNKSVLLLPFIAYVVVSTVFSMYVQKLNFTAVQFIIERSLTGITNVVISLQFSWTKKNQPKTAEVSWWLREATH